MKSYVKAIRLHYRKKSDPSSEMPKMEGVHRGSIEPNSGFDRNTALEMFESGEHGPLKDYLYDHAIEKTGDERKARKAVMSVMGELTKIRNFVQTDNLPSITSAGTAPLRVFTRFQSKYTNTPGKFYDVDVVKVRPGTMNAYREPLPEDSHHYHLYRNGVRVSSALANSRDEAIEAAKRHIGKNSGTIFHYDHHDRQNRQISHITGGQQNA